MQSSNPRRAISLLFLAQVLLLTGCVSYEPAILVPALNLSPEDIQLSETAGPSDARIDFGLDLGLS